MFDRLISIDWSGANMEDHRGDLRVVEATPDQSVGVIVDPPRIGTRRWKRAECREWLFQALQAEYPRCLVAMAPAEVRYTNSKLV